ncbi:MAG: squalene synthase HpnC [Burkholderiales bacterium]|nr:squalene synthase HpnC [Burkholderiales bacterium]
MTVRHYENFPVASVLVPARLRPAVVALYRFARAADDLADEGDVPPPQRLAALAAFDAALIEIAAGGTPSRFPFPALADAVRQHGLPIAPMHDLVSAFRQDVSVHRYATFADLRDYCRRSADPVGRLLLALYHAQSPANIAASDAVCTGLQLTNFWQDIAGDWRIGRVYLPQEDMDRFGATIEHIAQARVDAHWRALLAFETARARTLLKTGRPLVRALPWRLGLELSAVIEGGLRILARIDAAGGDVFARRPVLRKRDWCAIAYHALVSYRGAPA